MTIEPEGTQGKPSGLAGKIGLCGNCAKVGPGTLPMDERGSVGVEGRRGGRSMLGEASMQESGPIDVRIARRTFLATTASLALAGTARAGSVDVGKTLARADGSRRRAHLAEHAGAKECIDLYYEGAVFAYAALAADPCGPRSNRALGVYNASLAGCLRAASRHRAIDPRSHLIVRGPGGVTSVPVVHRGFVWSPADFHGLLDPSASPRNPSNFRDHSRVGVGAPQVVVRKNVRATPEDAFLHDPMFFPATAVLRPDLNAWLGGAGGPGDVLEFHDPLRVGRIDMPGSNGPLAADFDAPIAYLERSTKGLESGWSGLLNPSQDVNRAFLGLLEPFQPGKIPVIFVHGLYDTPYTFTDLMNGLRLRPGFLDRYQIAGYRYATGLTFLHSAALFRRDLHNFQATFDPSQADPGFQDSVLIGHSMGGLQVKLQVVSSGDAFWDLVSCRPLGALAATDRVRSTLGSLFYFDPVPFVRRAIFLATPHDGLSAAASPGGVLSERLTRPPQDLKNLAAQVDADNPGAIRPYMHDLPNSIGMLRRREPLHRTLRDLPIAPHVRYNTVAGTGRFIPPAIARGDGIVPVKSASLDGAETQVLVPESHTTINTSQYTLVEVDRILRGHAAG